jgi:excisionase family DNA binding protein
MARTNTKLEPLTVSVAEAAELLGVSARSVWLMLAKGTLPATRLGRRTLVPLAAVKALVAARTTRA